MIDLHHFATITGAGAKRSNNNSRFSANKRPQPPPPFIKKQEPPKINQGEFKSFEISTTKEEDAKLVLEKTGGGGLKTPTSTPFSRNTPSSIPPSSNNNVGGDSRGSEHFRVNAEIINVETARCIGPDGTKLGDLSLSDIQKEATSRKLDMVEVQPGVIKLMDFQKFLEGKRKARKQSQVLMGTAPKGKDLEEFGTCKEISIGINIGFHDFEVKKDQIKRFLEKKHPVKLVVKKARGGGSNSLPPEIVHRKIEQFVERVKVDLKDYLTEDTSASKSTKQLNAGIVKFFYPKT